MWSRADGCGSFGAEHGWEGLRCNTDGAVAIDRLGIVDSELQLVGVHSHAPLRWFGAG